MLVVDPGLANSEYPVPFFKRTLSCWVWWHALVIRVLGRLGQEDLKSRASLASSVSSKLHSKTLSLNNKRGSVDRLLKCPCFNFPFSV